MFKKGLSLFLAIIMMFSVGTAVYAQGVDTSGSEGEIQPCYVYTSTVYETLMISNGTATCESSATGYSGTTTKIVMTMHLEKKTLLWWSDVENWTTTVNSYHGTFTKFYSVGSGTYRVRTEYVVYSGSKSETITGYSTEVKC